jgi:D-3-phosphoglycerate dehydrogenase
MPFFTLWGMIYARIRLSVNFCSNIPPSQKLEPLKVFRTMPHKLPSSHSTGPRVVVTSSSFSKSNVLREELQRSFQNCFFNEQGRPLTKEADLIEFIKDADAAVVGVEHISERILDNAPNLKIISKYGVGLDNLNEALLEQRNIKLGWTGGVNRRSVAEHTLCLMLGLCRNIFSAGFKLKQSDWDKNGGWQLTGKTVGVIGGGYTGSEVIRLLEPFQCNLLVNDIIHKSELCKEFNATEASLEGVLAMSDIISLHVPLTSLTERMVNADFLRKMQPTSFLINTSRGNVVDLQALKTALQQNDIAGAALDVFLEEPPEDSELLALPNLMVTPHIAGNARESVEAMGRSAIAHLISFFKNP